MFQKGWDGYSDAFKDYWKNLGRSEKSKVINQGILKDKSGKLVNAIMDTFKLEEEIKKRKTKEFEQINNSYILEQAENLVGGPDRLRQAISRGDVLVQSQGGIQMYTFPSTRLSLLDGVSHSTNSRAEVLLGNASPPELQKWEWIS